VLFAILVSALVGGLFGRSALATDDKVPEHYRAFTAALNAIETSYIDKVDSDNLVYGAVRGMLGTLDPHSSFLQPEGIRADARAPGRALLRHRRLDSGDRRRHHRDAGVRAVARLQERHSPRRRAGQRRR